MIEILVHRNIEEAFLRLRREFDPIRRELRDREYFLTRSQRRKRKDIRAKSRMRKKEQRRLSWRKED